MSNMLDALRFAYRSPYKIAAVAWSPTDKILATGNAAGYLQLWDAATGQEQECTQLHEEWVLTLCWSPTGNQVLSSGLDGRIAIYDRERADTRTFYQYSLSYDSEEVAGTNYAQACWSPDGHYIATCGYDPGEMMIRVWEASTGTLVQHWPCKRKSEPSHYSDFIDDSYYIATSLQWSPTGRWLVTGDECGTAHLWDPFSAVLLASYETPWRPEYTYSNNCRVLAWSPDGRYLASGDNYGGVHVWDTQQHRQVATCAEGGTEGEESSSTTGLAWLPDGTLASVRRSVQIHDPMTGKHLATILPTLQIGERYLPTYVVWSPDWTTLASVGGYNTRGDEETENEETGDERPLYEGFLHLWDWPPMKR